MGMIGFVIVIFLLIKMIDNKSHVNFAKKKKKKKTKKKENKTKM